MNEDPLKETMDYIKNTKEGMMEYTSDYARWKREGEEKERRREEQKVGRVRLRLFLRKELLQPAR